LAAVDDDRDDASPPTPRAALWVLRSAAGEWRRFPRLAAVAIGALVVQQLSFTGFAFSLKVIVDDITKHEPGSRLATVLGVLLVGFALTAVATVRGERASGQATARIVNGVRRDLYAHLLRLSPSYFVATPAGWVIRRFDNDLKLLEGGYIKGFLDTVVVLTSTAITIPVLFLLEWRLALIVGLTLPLVIAAVYRLLPWSVSANDAVSASELDIVNAVQDTVRAQQVVRTFHLEPVLTKRFDDVLDVQQRRAVRARAVAATAGRGASLGVWFVQLIVVVVGAELAAHDVMSVGSLVGFVTVLSLMAKNVYDFAKEDLSLLAEAGRGARGLDELLSAAAVVVDPADRRELPHVDGTITFDRVSFAYEPGKPALTDVSFVVPARASLAVVGTNGSGKSTILSLLMRFYDPQQGSIAVDGRDVRDVTQHSLRSQMGVVLHTNFIFNDTIRENIRVGNRDASDDEVVAAARRAELHDFVASLPQGYDTPVGESGGRLSAGQRQRLAIARALIRDPRIVLLDEVTTALDPAAERAVNAMLARVGEGRTVVSVTHRLAAARDADEILVLDRGGLVERGRHDDLFAAQGIYRTLWDKQGGFEVSGDGRTARVDGRRLRHVTLFTDLDDDALEHIAIHLTSEYYEADQTVFEQGERGDRFYLIARGQVEVVALAADGRDHVLELLSDGDHFGELALLQDQPRTATIRTVRPSVFLTMGRDDFLKLVATMPNIARMLEQRVARSELNLEEFRHLVGLRSERPQSG
jgi:ATP-binding cassette subfamily B protein